METDQEIDSKIQGAVNNLEGEILKYKKELYSANVSDSNDIASSMNPMITYHTLFLQSISYWMGLINSQKNISKPHLPDDKLFNKISDMIKNISKYNSDSKVLVYNSLIKLSNGSAFSMTN
jgi:hypothetical protein